MIRNERGRFVHYYELYPLLGLDAKRHLPKEGFTKSVRVGPRLVKFVCEPANGTPGVRPGKHQRIKFVCDCGRLIPFGRAEQHLRACAPYQRNEAYAVWESQP